MRTATICLVILAAAPAASAQTADVIGEIGGVLGGLTRPGAVPPPRELPRIDTVWGKPVGGLQAGIRPAPNSAASAVAVYDIVVRNVGVEPVTLSYLNLAFGGDNVDGTITAGARELTSQFSPKGQRHTAKIAARESRSLGVSTTARLRANSAAWLDAATTCGENHHDAGNTPNSTKRTDIVPAAACSGRFQHRLSASCRFNRGSRSVVVSAAVDRANNALIGGKRSSSNSLR